MGPKKTYRKQGRTPKANRMRGSDFKKKTTWAPLQAEEYFVGGPFLQEEKYFSCRNRNSLIRHFCNWRFRP